MKCERGVIAGIEIALIVMVCLLAAGALAPLGCAGSPVQKPTQTIAPDSATAAKLSDVQAQVLTLAQQNTAIINAIQKSAQDADAFRTETKGSIASLTQNQFWIESWMADSSAHWVVRAAGVDTFPRPGALSDDHLVGVGGDVPRGDLPHVGAAGAGTDGKPVAVKKKGPSMFWLIVAFVLGVIVSQVFEALEPAVQAKASAEEKSLYGSVISLVHGAWSFIFGGKKKTAVVAQAPAATVVTTTIAK